MKHIHQMSFETPSRRARDPDAKREAVHGAAMALFAKDGFENVSVADIARAAQVAVGTVYRLYPNKIAVLQSLHATMEAVFVSTIRKAWDSNLAFDERVENLVIHLIALIRQERERLVILSMTTDITYTDGSLPGDSVRAEIADVIRKEASRGHPIKTEPTIAASILHGAVEGAMRHALRAQIEDDKHVAKALISAIMAVLGPEQR